MCAGAIKGVPLYFDSSSCLRLVVPLHCHTAVARAFVRTAAAAAWPSMMNGSGAGVRRQLETSLIFFLHFPVCPMAHKATRLKSILYGLGLSLYCIYTVFLVHDFDIILHQYVRQNVCFFLDKLEGPKMGFELGILLNSNTFKILSL